MEIKGYNFTVATGSPDSNMQTLQNLNEGKGSPIIKNFLIPQKAELDLIFVTMKHINTATNFLVNVPLSSLRQDFIIPLNLPEGDYQISFTNKNLVPVNVSFSGVVEIRK